MRTLIFLSCLVLAAFSVELKECQDEYAEKRSAKPFRDLTVIFILILLANLFLSTVFPRTPERN